MGAIFLELPLFKIPGSSPDRASINSNAYCGHSLRIATNNGMKNTLIKMLRSLAYMSIRIPRNKLAQ